MTEINKKYLDNEGLRLLWEKPPYKQFFLTIINPIVLKFGTYKGNIQERSIEPFFAVVSWIQYWMKGDGMKIVPWWHVQHILASYMIICLTDPKGTVYTRSNENQFVDAILKIFPFRKSYIIDTLRTLYNHSGNYKDEQYMFYNPKPFLAQMLKDANQEQLNPDSGGIVPDKFYPTLVEERKTGNYIFYGALALLALLIFKK